MKIGIIGSGNVGRALAQAFGSKGHAVALSARNPAHAEAAAKETGAESGSNKEVVAGADVVVMAMPTSSIDEVVAEVGADLKDKIVVDTTNRFRPDDPGSAFDGTSNAEVLQQKLPDARVVKALNTIFASRMANPTIDGVPLDGYVAGDDDEAKRTVLDLLRDVGYRPLDTGSLSMARALEGMGILVILLQITNGWTWSNGWKLIGPTS